MLEYTENGVERKYPYCDYEYLGKSDWNYGYSSDTFEIVRNKVDQIPFSSEKPAITLKTKVKKVEWDLEEGYETICGKVPTTYISTSEEEEMILYPYGCAKIRMTEIPFVR